MGYHPSLPHHNPNATVSSINDFISLYSTVTSIIINNGISEPIITVLDLTRFFQLKSLVVGHHCFSYVQTVIICELNALESVEIGENSFTKQKNGAGYNPDRHFYLKNCPKLKSLKIGRHSFSDYGVIEIENVDALEVIEMGELNKVSYNFRYASLELKSSLIHSE